MFLCDSAIWHRGAVDDGGVSRIWTKAATNDMGRNCNLVCPSMAEGRSGVAESTRSSVVLVRLGLLVEVVLCSQCLFTRCNRDVPPLFSPQATTFHGFENASGTTLVELIRIGGRDVVAMSDVISWYSHLDIFTVQIDLIFD
jgi:hypothetical protein